MGRTTNKFSKAIRHIKSTEIDDKLAVLESAPTNNTMGYMSRGVHGLPKPDISTTVNNFPTLPVPDFTQDALSNGRDTTGLFNASGVHAEGTWIRTKEPPGDTSYVLGPMAAMYYTWSYPWTTIGYIRESDRKMVNLAKISGKLSDWDGVSNFSSSQYGGQLTLEQAVWFRDVKKLNNAGNDPDNANYRAFYPGPPSNTPDEHGRYHCVITGDPKNQDETTVLPDPGRTEPDPEEATPDEVFAAIMERLKRGEKLTEEQKQFLRDHGMDGFVDDLEGGNVAYDAISELIGLGVTFAAVKALLPTIIAAGRGALKYVKDWYNTGRNISVPNEGTARWRELVKNDWDQIGKFSKGTGKWYPRNAAEIRQIFTGEGGIIWSFTRGFHTSPTPAFRQAVERLFKTAFGGGKGLWKWHYEPQGQLISESRRSTVLKNIKKPVVLPKEQKKFKVKPKLRTSSKYMGSTPKISKPVETPKEYKQVGGRNLWGKEEYNYNVRQSQERMNQVYELVGDGDHAFDYMLNDSKKLNDEQMEKFWGKNPDFYSYFYGGKKYKLVRKEEMDGDFLVFLVDDHGERSNILQSELNEKLAEEQEKKELEEYNKMNSKEPVSVEKDYMFKKVQNRLKPQIDYKDKPAKMGYPNDPPPEMVNNRHPDFGKPPGSSYYNKLDPKSAAAMPQQDDPTIDAKVKDAKENPKKDSAMYRRKLDDKMKKEREKFNKEEWEKSDWRKDLLGEGMNTQMLTGILPSAGNSDLENIQLGLTGEGDIDYGEPGTGDESMEGEGQYTCFSNLDILDNVDEPNNTGTRLRLFDQETKEFRDQGHGGGEHGFLLAMPGYQRGMLRNVKPTGDYNAYDKAYRTNKGLPLKQNGTDLYYHIYGQTNDELGKGYGSWNSNDGLVDSGMGVVLNFNGPGSPRYVALKAIDSTEFDTIKLHAAVGSSSMTSNYRDGDGVLRDKRVQIYYWAGDHKDYVKHPSATGIYDGTKTASQDGWRPINMKPNGELDDTVDPYIIKLAADRDTHGVDANGASYSAAGKLHPYSVPLPEYTRGKNARYIIVQVDKNNSSDDSAFSLASVRFQRKSILRVPSISKPLTDLEGAAFVRVGQGVDKNAEQRRKSVRDLLKSSKKYVNKIVGDPFPGTDAEVGEAQGTSGSEYVPQAWDDKRQEFGDVGTLDQQKDKFVSKDVKLPPTYADIQKAKKKK